MEYGAKVWGWKERKGIERLEEKYMRWVLGVEGRTPGYIIKKVAKKKVKRKNRKKSVEL